MSRIRDLTGQRFGRLTVLEQAGRYVMPGSGDKHVTWKCICDCGQSITVVGRSLADGSTRSCGCLQRETASALGHASKRYGEDEGAYRQHYGLYKSNASRRGHVFDLTFDAFMDLVTRKCAYCGSEPKSRWKSDRYAVVPMNSIDRVDNELGYIEGNMATCCPVCNRAKRDMTKEEFEEWLNRLVEFRTR